MKLLLFLLLLATRPAGAADPDSVQVAPDFHAPASDTGVHYTFGDFLLRDRTAAPQGYLAVSLGAREMQWYQPPTRFDAVLTGAGAATSLGMFLGAVGTTLGWFSEDTSWAITGAMAAAGALYAGARYQPQPKLDFKWGENSVIPGYAPPVSH